MDNAPPDRSPAWPLATTSQDSDADTDTESNLISHALSKVPVTPTKPSRQSLISSNDHTPRPTQLKTRSLDWTPRPSTLALSSAHECKGSKGKEKHTESAEASTQGFTISYLRRVPELADMASRVVKAEAKRRVQAEHKRMKEEAARGSKVEIAKNGSRETIAPKMKRLFSWAIVKLYEEGSIVLWDGPVRVCQGSGCGGGGGTSGLWKLNSSHANTAADDSVFSTVSSVVSVRRGGAGGEDDDGALSDPEPHEEAYVSLTPALLAVYVEKAIGTLMARSAEAPRRGLRSIRPPAPAPGPMKEDVLMFLRRADERWARVGEWAVDEALEVLAREGKAWDVGGGRWELCL
jgi:hypothetical protein